MRNTKLFAGTALLAALVLTGCSTGGSADSGSGGDSTSSGSSTTATTPAAGGGADEGSTDADAGDCPELTEGATVEPLTLGTCSLAARDAAAGYAFQTESEGIVTKMQMNPGDGSLAITSPIGNIVTVDDATYVQPAGGDWQEADPDSTDQTVAMLSQMAGMSDQIDPSAGMSNLTGSLTVTGKDTRLDRDVWVLTGDLSMSGNPVTMTYYVTDDWVPLEIGTSATVSGATAESTTVFTEWDKKQDIVAPM